MIGAMSPGRFILRVELAAGGRTAITYGFDLTPTSVFVVSDWADPGDAPIAVTLSFPRVLAPIALTARVTCAIQGGAPGELAGLHLEFAPNPAVAELLARLAHPEGTGSLSWRVLLVEDSGLIRDVFAHNFATYFRAQGELVVDHAATAEAAWQMLADEAAAYDLAIVDHVLPAESGAALIARVRGDARLAQLPVVAISVGGAGARDATIAAGADLFVDKPIVFRDLFSTLRILWQQQQAS